MESYQNEEGNTRRKREEMDIPDEDSLKHRTACRQVLLPCISVAFLLASVFMATVVYGHQQRSRGVRGGDDVLYYYNDDNDSARGRDGGGIKRSTFDNKLDDLNRRTNASIPSGCETTLIMVRHCEKEGVETVDKNGNEHCNYLGYERAYFIPSLFGSRTTKNDAKWPVPTALFALAPQRSKNMNFREVETLVPLANKYGLGIESDFPDNIHMAKRLFQGLSTGDWCGTVVVISWKHSFFGDLAQQLGCVDCPDDYPDRAFDEVWQLKYVYDVEHTPIIQASLAQPTNPTPRISTFPSPKRQEHLRRELKKTKKEKREGKRAMPDKRWSVYSSITNQNFDPLKFSASVGDYDGGIKGGKWFPR